MVENPGSPGRRSGPDSLRAKASQGGGVWAEELEPHPALESRPSPSPVPEAFRSRSGLRRLWFRSHSVSLKRINSRAIVAVPRIPVQMEFLVATGDQGAGETKSGAESKANKFSPAQMLLFKPNPAPSSGRIPPMKAFAAPGVRIPLAPPHSPRFSRSLRKNRKYCARSRRLFDVGAPEKLRLCRQKPI